MFKYTACTYRFTCTKSDPPASNCPASWFPGDNGKCYFLGPVTEQSNTSDAANKCATLNATLASCLKPEGTQFVSELTYAFSSWKNWWIGLDN
jgi:hypothetical protein